MAKQAGGWTITWQGTDTTKKDFANGQTIFDGLREAIVAGGGELLRAAMVFDLYVGEQLGEGRKSLALNLEFRAPDRTLTDEEVAGLREQIEAKLGEIGGTLRG
jgi:phenylalanyl-tRNA synthetase beta chain